jgi:hypothetical protein
MVGLISADILAHVYYTRPYTRSGDVDRLLLLAAGGE